LTTLTGAGKGGFMTSLRFGTFIAPHHRVGYSPSQQMRDDLDLIVHLDNLGFDEVWIGEHHSTGVEIYASPEVMVAAAAERTKTIKLGMGVNSLPYHHPFILADRWVMLSHLTRGRTMFGVGPGSLPTDSWQMGLDPMENRKIMEASLEAIVALLDGEEPVTRDTEWFQLRDARLQLLPFRREYDLRVAAMVSPSGPRAAGRFGLGMISVAATTPAGFDALKGAWGTAEERAEEYGKTVSRQNWGVVAPVHLAETVEQAHKDVHWGMTEWVDYFKKTVPLPIGADADNVPEAIADLTEGTGLAVIGTPDMAIAQIERLLDQTGGLGTFLIQAHDWADPVATRKSYELFAKQVIPHFDGSFAPRFANNAWCVETAVEAKRQFSAAQEKAQREHDESKSAVS
jgi:limonene 1,2-monooxygenase